MTDENQQLIDRLRGAGLRPTKQRQSLGELLFSKGNRHITAERLHEEAMAANVPVSLATVYNTLHQFTTSGLLREVVVEGAKTYFDTNTSQHFHFYHEENGQLIDMPADMVLIDNLPDAPDGTKVTQVDVTVRIAKK
ncbi:MAG: transcriptional repressor [Hyphomicrobiaceae bacterium]|nr:transcriptional repressor [Hyphomicrobiaceae bacterium]